MPFADTVSIVSGRNSRASNVSGATGASRSHRAPPAVNDTMANAGVLSMLKTTTDTGDIGALSFNTSRLPSMPRATHAKRGHRTRSSINGPHHNPGVPSNHSYAPSQTSRVSLQWDASSTHRRGSLTSMQSMPPSLPPAHLSGKPSLGTMPPTPDNPRDSRSYSMTSAPSGQPLSRQRSASSLKSQGHEPLGHRMPPGPVPPMPDNRGPFVYPTRLKRPGYRSPSPALSDIYAGHAPPPGAYPIGRGTGVPRGPPPQAVYNGYNTGYPMEYVQDPRHLNVRPPPRTANSSPGNMGFMPNQFDYRQGASRPMPPMPMPHQMPQPSMYAPQQPLPRNVHPAPPFSPYGAQYPTRMAYMPHPHMQYQGPRAPPPPANPNIAPMAHHMFHNAARMARNVPYRTDTPMTAGDSPPSSDPQSSSSAPTSSNPPTPKDHTTIRVGVDPAFIDPALMDLPDSSSEPVLPAKYFEYADGPLEDHDMEVPHSSVPQTGFVQRVKAMLESKAINDAAVAQTESDEKTHQQQMIMREQYMQEYANEHEQEEVSDLVEFHELAANETPRFTIIEEFEAPVELPASPVKVPELDAIETTVALSTQRITREMIRAELGPSSPDNTSQQVKNQDGSTDRMVMEIELRTPHPSHQVETRAEDLDNQIDTDAVNLHLQSHTPNDTAPENATTTTTATIEASIPTGMDYALRFTAPIDTTIISTDETQSGNPFALDADTITFQQQQSKDGTTQPESHQELQDPDSPEQVRGTRERAQAVSSGPISPLRSDDIVKRSSAVSPLHTQTLGIDGTLHMASLSGMTSSEEQTDSDLYAEDTMPPPTPRTPKTYSKSVQLHPRSHIESASTGTNTNRYSLPGDMSTIGDMTGCSASDMVTDVAVRFSLPGTTITIGKPHIVDISAGSTPDKPKFDFGLPQQTPQRALEKTARRTSSVTFADEVAPLNIFKKSEPLRPLSNIKETSAFPKTKSIIRKQSPRADYTMDSGNGSRESTTDLRYSAMNQLNGITKGFESTYLPGLKEESVEDMSISDRKRSSDLGQFPLPARIAAVKAMQERRLQESADKAKARRQARQHNRSIAETRDLPSLNFSRMDLIDKLNEALEVRPAKSLETIRRRDFSGIHCPSPQRPLSTEPLRDRYTSFFNKPEDFSFFDDSNDSNDEDEDHFQPTTDNALVPTVQIQEQTEIEEVEREKERPLSPEDFLSVATQVNRLSIPSVNGLSERLSELIPGLKNLQNLQLDGLLASEYDESTRGNELSRRPDTAFSNRTSAGFRTLAERAEEIVKNGTHDSIVAAIRALSLNKELPALPASTSVDQLAGTASPETQQAYLSGSVSAPVDLCSPVRPMSALLRHKAPTTEDEVRQLLPIEMNPIARNARRSMVLSQPSSRPWNLDENYPWSGNKVEIDLSVPDQAHTRESFTSELQRQRGTKSLDLTSPKDTTDTRGIDIGSIYDTRLDSSASLTAEQLTGISSPPQHARKHSKRSIIGSISKKFGLSRAAGPSTTANNTTTITDLEDTTTKSTLSPRSPIPGRISSADHPSHRAGDRYPTSALTPPANFNLDEVRSFFSDNSSERERTASFRKRLTYFKSHASYNREHGTKSKAGTRSGTANRNRSLDHDGAVGVGSSTLYDAGSMLSRTPHAGGGVTSSANHYEGVVGMSKTEFHLKRFGEKLRLFFAKSGELVRGWSVRDGIGRKGVRGGQQVEGEDDHREWLADSLYSGV
ncbi:unnamed protein product [Zymoseptoria tritici ST99CH_3D7]|uniref:Uncharacterized protein n=1 Tax=Zymoseptoria tritici (strain ST99CH_3D7) TaxID=1276538 RepID=A0A1X7S765_ZYMT9|nr:unnamed protein product [Zymoseptoria tritici ST99CH_3D7]